MMKQQGFGQRVKAGLLALAAGSMLIGVALTSPATAPAVVGDWSGALNTGGGSLRVVIHVSQDKDGKLTATMDSPDQGATGTTITSISYKEPNLHFELGNFGASYDGTMNKDNSEIAGTWKQSGTSLPLSFKRAGN
jgi:hypothetical protein